MNFSRWGKIYNFFTESYMPVCIILAHLALCCPYKLYAENADCTALDSKPILDAQNSESKRNIHIFVGQSQVLTSETPLKKIYVGAPSVIHSFTSGQREMLITAKRAGISSLVVWDVSGTHQLYTISSDLDVRQLRSALCEAFPLEHIQAAADQDKVILSGITSSTTVIEAAAKLAASYSKDVMNNLQLSVPRQTS